MPSWLEAAQRRYGLPLGEDRARHGVRCGHGHCGHAARCVLQPMAPHHCGLRVVLHLRQHDLRHGVQHHLHAACGFRCVGGHGLHHVPRARHHAQCGERAQGVPRSCQATPRLGPWRPRPCALCVARRCCHRVRHAHCDRCVRGHCDHCVLCVRLGPHGCLLAAVPRGARGLRHGFHRDHLHGCLHDLRRGCHCVHRVRCGCGCHHAHLGGHRDLRAWRLA